MPKKKPRPMTAQDVKETLGDIERIVHNLMAGFSWVPSKKILAKDVVSHFGRPKAQVALAPVPGGVPVLFLAKCQDSLLATSRTSARVPRSKRPSTRGAKPGTRR